MPVRGLRRVGRIFVAVMVGWCPFALALGATGPPQLLLDLTRRSVAQTESAIRSGCGGGMSVATEKGQVPPLALPLRIRIASLNAKEYTVGEELTAHLLVRNIGSKSIRIPASVNQSLVFGPACKWQPSPGLVGLHGSIGLTIEDHSGNRGIIASHGLYAISNEPDTYRVLSPGQSIMIIIAGKVNLPNITTTPTSESHDRLNSAHLIVRATFSMDEGPVFGRYGPVVSSNHARIAVTEGR